jgi:hypothetical protein
MRARARALALVAVAVLAIVLAACGGGSSNKTKLASARSTTTTPADAAGSTTTVAGGGSAATNPGGQTITTAKGSPATTAPGAPGGQTPRTFSQAPDPQVTSATLDKPCIHRGNPAELQGLNVHMLPKQTLGYETVYSDYSNGASNPSYKTGHGYGQSDDNGNFKATWVVPANAPTGKATVYLLTSPNHAPIQLPFNLVALGAKCP